MKPEIRNKNDNSAKHNAARSVPDSINASQDQAIRLNSRVEILDTSSGIHQNISIVMPDLVDLKNSCISVFAPLSNALLGHGPGDQVTMTSNGIRRELRILRVMNPKT